MKNLKNGNARKEKKVQTNGVDPTHIVMNEVFLIMSRYYLQLFQGKNPKFSDEIKNSILMWARYTCGEEKCKECSLNNPRAWISESIQTIPGNNLCGLLDKMFDEYNLEL